MMEFAETKRHKARKDYECDICSGKIAAGQQYVRYTGRYDGDFFDWKYHADCHTIIDIYLRETAENEYDEESISEWIDGNVCCNLCDIETRDDCFRSAFNCEKVLAKLGIKPIGE